MKRKALSVLLVVLSIFVFASCMQSIAFEVSFIVDGEVYDTVKTNGSSTIKMPTDPTKEGYTFDGWYWDKDSWEKPFTASSLLDAPLTSNMSVYAKWKRIDASSCTHVDDNNDDKCDVCGEAYTNSSDLPAHTHSYTVQNTDFAYIASEADCENAAKYYYACSCGKKGTETFTSGSAIGHTEVIDAAIDPTCTITGLTEGKRCSVCKEILVPQRTVMALGHTEVVDAAVAPTCTATGLTEGKHCSICNHVIKAQTVVDALDHDLVNANGKAATCTEAGYTAYKDCSRCDYTEGYEIIPAGHDLFDVAAQNPATCIDGYTAGKMCLNCDYVEGMEVIPAQHAYGAVQPGMPATCLLPGWTDYKICTECHKMVGAENIDPLGHELQPVNAKTATCYTDGYSAHQKCSRCYYTKGKTVYPAAHTGTWVSDGNNEYIICTIESCGRKAVREKDAAVNFENGAIIDANGKLAITNVSAGATAGGNTRDKFTLVDDASNKVLKVVSSKANANATAAKITLNHTDADHSIATGGKYLVTEFDVKFDFNTGVNTSKVIFALSLYDNNGNHIYNFNFHSYGQKVKTNGIQLDYVADGTTWLTFRAVTELATERNAAGIYVATTKLYYKHRDAEGAMTYLTSGTKTSTYTGHTGRTDAYVTKLEIGPNDHDYTYYLDNMSFVRTADSSCIYSDCNHSITETVIPATATSEGVVKRHCTVNGCGYAVAEYIPVIADSHDMDNGVITKAPTCTEPGVKTYTCKNGCGYTTTETVPALGHTLSDWTDTADGKEEGTCSICGYKISRAKNVITFDDGTVTGGKLIFPDSVDISEDGKWAVDAWHYASWDVIRRDDNIMLSVLTIKEHWASGRATLVAVPITDGSTAGNTYTFDFDICIEPGEDSLNNSSRVVMQIYFGGSAFNLGTFGTKVNMYGNSQTNFGTINSWISFRFVYAVTDDGAAELEVLVKGTEGNYSSVYTADVTGSSIYLDGVDKIVLSSYAGANNFTYYLDNISFTRARGITDCDHIMGAGNYTTEPTCTEAGVWTRTCTNGCGYTTTETVPALGHTEVVDAAKAATCTETGLTEGKHCLVCGTQTIAQEVVPTTGHTFGEWVDAGDNNKRRECEICGYSEVKKATTDGDNIDDGGWV